MILLSITLLIFTNIFILALLADNTTVRSLKDYLNYSDKIMIIFNLIWILITAFIILFVK
jgi:hypothetical protein